MAPDAPFYGNLRCGIRRPTNIKNHQADNSGCLPFAFGSKNPALRETVQRLQQAGEELLDEGLFGIRDQTVADLQRITDEEFESCQWTMTE